jgi:hypothetical protein
MTLVHPETGELVEPLTETEAERLTTRIALKLDAMADTYAGVMPLITEAIDRQAYAALGYNSVSSYISDRFGGSLAKLGLDVRREVVRELSDAGMSSRAIAPVVGTTDRQVRRDIQVGHASHLTQTSEPATAGEGAAGSEQTPGGEVVPAPPEADATTPSRTATPRPPVVGLDGKTYTPKPPRPLRAVDEAKWDEQDRAEELARNLSRNLSLLYAVTSPERRAEYIANWSAGTKALRPLGADHVTPEHMRDLSAALLNFANEWEQADV